MKTLVRLEEHFTLEIDLDEVKELYGSTEKKYIEEYAWDRVDEGTYERKVVILKNETRTYISK